MVVINSKTGALSYPVDYFTLGHFSKFIYSRAKRIYSSNASGILTSAYLNPDGSKALVAFNDSTVAQTFQLNWGSEALTYTLPSLSAATLPGPERKLAQSPSTPRLRYKPQVITPSPT